jgi:ABC-type transport system involved in cytochrome bd biosynthesis fused ATPase/permease subunit
MNTSQLKTLTIVNGIVGLVGGIVLLFGGWFVVGSAVSSVANGSASNFSAMGIFLFLIKVAILVLGIIGAVQFKKTDKVTTAPSVLLIVGGAVSIIPFLGWVGGIVAIVGGSLYLAKIKNFNN